MKFQLVLLAFVLINQCYSQDQQDPNAAGAAAGGGGGGGGGGSTVSRGQFNQYNRAAPAPPPAAAPVAAPLPVPQLIPAPLPVPLSPNPFVGFGGPGLFGLGGLGFGLGLGGGFGFNPLWRNPLGKREIEEAPVNRTTCSYVAASSMIRCIGMENIECEVRAHLEDLKNITIRLPSLNIVPEIIEKETEVLRLVSRMVESRWTFVHPMTGETVMLSIYPTRKEIIPGFMVKDEKCFRQIRSLVSPTSIEKARFSLIVRQI